MISEYIAAAMARAKYKKLSDGTWYATISGIRGVWANARKISVCKSELQEVLEEWLLLELRSGTNIRGLQNGKQAVAKQYV